MKALGHSAQLITMMEFCLKQKVISRGVAKVYMAIAQYWNPEQNIFPSRKTLAHCCGYKNERNVSIHTRRLKALNLIDFFQPQSGEKRHQSNQYHIHFDALRELYSQAKQKQYRLKKAQKTDPAVTVKNDPPISINKLIQKKIIETPTISDVILNAKNYLKSCCSTFKIQSAIQSRLQSVRQPTGSLIENSLNQHSTQRINELLNQLTMAHTKQDGSFTEVMREELLSLTPLQAIDQLRLEQVTIKKSKQSTIGRAHE